jgi:hypothetical protein
MILQSNSPIRLDIQEESKTVVFRCFQSKPLLNRLRMNKPLSTVEDVGTTPYFQGKAHLEPVGRAAADSDPIGSGRRTGRAAGGGVMTNHPTSSSGFEEAARAGAAPPPTGLRHGPPTSNREVVTQATWRDTALLSIGGLRTENAALQIRVDELTLALALINADNNQLRRELAAIRIEQNTFRAEAVTA